MLRVRKIDENSKRSEFRSFSSNLPSPGFVLEIFFLFFRFRLMKFDRVWNVPTSEIQNLRNVKIKNRGNGKAGKRMDREKSSKNRGKRGLAKRSKTENR